MLDMSTTKNTRFIVVSGAKCPALQSTQPGRSQQPENAKDGAERLGGEPNAISITTAAMEEGRPAVNSASTAGPAVDRVLSPRTPQLSARELQVLNGLVKGHANKVIARTCDITESTVKVHIKSILRKIRLANRTQAAIWAVGNGYTESRGHSTNLAATANQISTSLAA
jgi:two-component system nitrate/nitrite response regulator NarL